jgi:diguanylate cyclase (GGDEF)-like protein/PAS domain S-box-containing protein
MDISKELLNQILSLLPEAVVACHEDFSICLFNQAAETIFGYTEQEVMGQPLSILIPADRRASHEKLILEFTRSRHPPRYMGGRERIQGLRKSGKTFPAEATISKITFHHSNYLVAIVRDITARVESEEQLRSVASQLELVLQATGDGIVCVDLEGVCTLINPAGAAILGFSNPETLIGEDMSVYLAPRATLGEQQYKVNEGLLEDIVLGRSLHKECADFKTRSGEIIKAEYRSHPIRKGGDLLGAVISFSNITDRVASTQMLEYIAQHDSLTGLLNRVMLQDRVVTGIARAKRSNTSVVILFIDLDRFKPINDQFGHLVGDKLLIAVANAISRQVRESDTVARLGGDEFVVVLEKVSRDEDLTRFATKIQEAIDTITLKEGNKVITTSASIGMASYPEDGQDFRTLIRKADEDMYQHKTRYRRRQS